MHVRNDQKFKLILASQSPRRKELLAYLKIPFEVMPSLIDEIIDPSLRKSDLVCDLAFQKANFIFKSLKHNDEQSKKIIIGADTIVVFKEKVFGKPSSKEEAQSFLMTLSGQSHDVYTGVCIMAGIDDSCCFFTKTEVCFSQIDLETLNIYLDTGEFADKAGGYGIQGLGLSFVKKIKGSYSNVVGFPLVEFSSHLKIFLNLNNDDWRKSFE